MMKKMRSWLLMVSIILVSSNCRTTRQHRSPGNEIVQVSSKYPVYFENGNGETWIPVMINYIVPSGQDEGKTFETIESYFRNFSAKGGNAMRIWISSPFLEIEDKTAGQYSMAKFKRIDKLLEFAKEYQTGARFRLCAAFSTCLHIGLH